MILYVYNIEEVSRMSAEFDKSVLFGNISYLIKQNNLKVGEIETEAGVSAGYIARASKDERSKPGIDFVLKVADILHVGLETLLWSNLEEATPTEKYIMNFLNKLNTDTVADKLDWILETKDELDRLEPDRDGFVPHPMFSEETFMETGESEYPEEVTRVVFVSHSFGCHTSIKGDCFRLRLKNESYLYIMNISKSVYSASDKDAFALEIWMQTTDSAPKFLCDDRQEVAIAQLVKALYSSVVENMRHPKINRDMQYVIDAFMHDDIEDDVPEVPDIPF